MIRLRVRASIDRHVRSMRVPTSVTSDRMVIRVICTVGKASLIAAGIRRLWEGVRKAPCWRIRGVVHCGPLGLHSKQMRWQDKAVLLM